MFNILRLVPLALFVASASSTALNTPHARSINGALTVARAPVASMEESVIHPVRETNAKRMARGLGPAAPNFKRASILPGRGHVPTRMGSARRSTPSGSSTPTYTIKVTRADNGGAVGYVKKTYINSSSSKRYGLTSSTTDALQVTLPAGQTSYIRVELVEPNPTDSAHPLFGAVVGPASTNDNLSSGSANYCFLTGTSHTDANAPPAAAGNSYGAHNSESAIWTYSTSTQKVSAQWVNTGGTKPATIIYYVPSFDGLALIGDANKYDSAFPNGFAVEFTLVAV